MYDPDRVKSLQRPHGLPFRIGKLGTRRAERARRGALGAVLHRGAGLPRSPTSIPRRWCRAAWSFCAATRPSRHRARRLDEERKRRMSSSTTSPSRSPPSTRSSARATICAGTASRSISPAAAAPDASSRSNSATLTITGWRSTGASTRSAATGMSARRPSGRACRASKERDRRSGPRPGHDPARPGAA